VLLLYINIFGSRKTTHSIDNNILRSKSSVGVFVAIVRWVSNICEIWRYRTIFYKRFQF